MELYVSLDEEMDNAVSSTNNCDHASRSVASKRFLIVVFDTIYTEIPLIYLNNDVSMIWCCSTMQGIPLIRFRYTVVVNC